MKIISFTIFSIIISLLFLTCEKKKRPEMEYIIPPSMTIEFNSHIEQLEDEKVYFSSNSHLYEDFDYEILIQDNFLGIYLPIIFIESLKNTKNYSYSMSLNNDGNRRNLYHHILIVIKNIIRSETFFDGSIIKAQEVQNFEFIENNQNMIIIDDKGFQYLKISNEIENINSRRVYENIIGNFISNIIFEELIKNEKIIIFEDLFYIIELNAFYKIGLDFYFDDSINIALRNLSGELFVLRTSNGRYTAYKTKGNYLMTNWEITDEIEFDIII
jgi:hypothetical protein